LPLTGVNRLEQCLVPGPQRCERVLDFLVAVAQRLATRSCSSWVRVSMLKPGVG
jgi:hypothetical protein